MADNNSTDVTVIGAGVGGKEGAPAPSAPTKVAGGIAGSGLGALGDAALARRKKKQQDDAAKLAGQQAGLAAVAKPSPAPGQ